MFKTKLAKQSNIFHSLTCVNMFPLTFTWYPNLDRYFSYTLETATTVLLLTFNLEVWNFATIAFTCKVLFKIHKFWPMNVTYMCENRVKWRFSQMRRLHISTLKKAALIFHVLIIDWEWLNFIKFHQCLLAFVLPKATLQSHTWQDSNCLYDKDTLPFRLWMPKVQ